MAETRVLVPLDRSTLAEKSLSYIQPFTLLGDLHVELVTVKETGDERGDVAAIEAYLAGEAEGLKRASATTITFRVLYGIPYLAILDEAEDERVAMIVISSHGWSGPEKWRVGSVADKVIRGSPCPILIVGPHSPQAPQAIKDILVPLDGSVLAEMALPLAGLMAEKLGAKIKLMRVVERESALEAAESVTDAGQTEADACLYLEKAAEKLPRNVQSERIVKMGPSAETIQDEVRRHPVDLIAMSSHGRHGFLSYALGSVTDRLLTGPTPVLIVRPGQRERITRLASA